MKFVVILISLLYFAGNTCQGDDSAKITLFYESLCPYCIKFITQQLYETMTTIPRNIKLDLVPYGNTKRKIVNGKWEFICQHGEEECYGNNVHACVLEQAKVKSPENLVMTLKCLMRSNYTTEAISKCFTVGKFDFSRYSRCMVTLRESLTLEFAARTERNVPKVTFVPFVMINDYYNFTLNEAVTTNLLGTVCRILDPAPEECVDNSYENFLK